MKTPGRVEELTKQAYSIPQISPASLDSNI